MSAAAATAKNAATAKTPAPAVEEAPPPNSKKKLILIVAGALALVLSAGGAGAVFMLKKKASSYAEAVEGAPEASESAPAKPAARRELASAPTFVPLDPFTVNLADREAERYAQLAVTLEIEDSKVGDRIKNFMPAIRSNILLAIADHTAAELLGREGKSSLAERIKREAARGMGYDIPPEHQAGADRRSAKPDGQDLPVKAVHFSNFIVQ